MNLSGKTAIVGIGATEFSKDSGRSELRLAAEATKAALDDAGIAPEEVDGLVTFTMDVNEEIEVARALSMGDLSFFSRIHYGGGAACATVHQAAMAVATGAAEVVVCYRALNGRSRQRFGASAAEKAAGQLVHYSWYFPFGLLTPASWVAMFARPRTRPRGSTNNPSRSRTIGRRDGSSNRCGCWTAARSPTAVSRSW